MILVHYAMPMTRPLIKVRLQDQMMMVKKEDIALVIATMMAVDDATPVC